MKAADCPRGFRSTDHVLGVKKRRIIFRVANYTRPDRIIRAARKSLKFGCHAVRIVLPKRGFPRIVKFSSDPRPGVKQSSVFGRCYWEHRHEAQEGQVLGTSKDQPQGLTMAKERRPNNAGTDQVGRGGLHLR